MQHLTLSLSLPPAALAEIISRLFSCFRLLSTSAGLNAALRTFHFKVSQVISLLCWDPPRDAACLSQSRSQKSLQSHYIVIWMLSTPASHQLLLSPGSVLSSHTDTLLFLDMSDQLPPHAHQDWLRFSQLPAGPTPFTPLLSPDLCLKLSVRLFPTTILFEMKLLWTLPIHLLCFCLTQITIYFSGLFSLL